MDRGDTVVEEGRGEGGRGGVCGSVLGCDAY